MSDFDYYEFQSIDRPLTKQAVSEISKLSSRSQVNSRRASFVYNYGSFQGNIEELMQAYFDAFLYVSSYGTKQIIFRIPTKLFKQEMCIYEYENIVEIETHGDYILISLDFNNDEGGEWIDEEECRLLLDDLIPIRDALIQGDPRALYVALLSQKDQVISEDEEDYFESLPIPNGMNDLDLPLETLSNFFEISERALKKIA